LLVITDSADHSSEHRFSDIEKQLKTLDAQVYTVLWDETEKWEYADITSNSAMRRRLTSDASNLSRAALNDLALRTGGSLQSPTVQNAEELFRIYSQIAFETKRQYTLGFYPEQVDGKWHNLRVGLDSVKDLKKMNLTYRTGYQSPQPKP
jgi:VWFA-related protein